MRSREGLRNHIPALSAVVSPDTEALDDREANCALELSMGEGGIE